MCGITVVIKKSDVALNHAKVREMNDSVIHRGPDASGLIFFKKSGCVNLVFIWRY